jgi:hypothetical protein
MNKTSNQKVLLDATKDLLQLGQETEVKAVFLTRGIRALIQLTSSPEIVKSASASTDYELLLSALSFPESLELLQKDDPLVEAKLRGLRIKQELLEAEGGCISVVEAAAILGISRQGVDKRRRNGQLIGIPKGKSKYLYPRWQFDEVKNTTITGLESVLGHLKNFDPWMQLSFILNPHLGLDDQTPLSLLLAGNLEPVMAIAISFGKHGSD